MDNYKRSFRQLLVWKKAKLLTLDVYKATNKFPKEEKYGLSSQLQRASSSIMANIVEGNERQSRKDCCRFLEIAKGSLAEIDCFIDLALELKYINSNEYNKLLEHINKTAYLLLRLINSQNDNPRRK